MSESVSAVLGGLIPTAASWALTYAVHSTLLLGATWLATRRGVTSHAVRDLLWKAALVGGLLTATLQLAAGIAPVGGRVAFTLPAHGVPYAGDRLDPAPPGAASARAAPVAEPLERDPVMPLAAGRLAASAPVPAPGPSDLPVGLKERSRPPRWGTGTVPAVGVALWAAIALTLLIGYALARYRLTRLLGRRHPVEDGRLHGLLATLQEAAGFRRPVRLTCAAGLASPVALGSSEICVPEAAIDELDPDQQRGMLAHELAHLARRDPWWLALACVLERGLFFQPLNRLARAGLQESAEYLCDDWAVRRTGSGLTLARCLVKVAEWMDTVPHPVPVAGMADLRSQFVSRIHRLLEHRGATPEPRRRWLLPLTVGFLALTAGAAPGITLVRVVGGAPAAPRGGGVERAVFAPAPRPVRVAAATDAGRSLGAAPPASPAASVTVAEWPSEVQSDTSRAVAALIQALKDSDVEVRRAAAQSLGQLEDPAAVVPLIGVLSDADPGVRKNAVEALAGFRDPRAVTPLMERLKDESGEVRAEAARGLGDLRDERAASALAASVSDPVAEVREQAIRALAELKASGAGAVDAFLGALKDDDPEVRQAAVHALSERSERRAVRPIMALLSDPSADVRHQAAHGLGELGDPQAADALSAVLKDGNADVREAAAHALGELELSAASPALLEALNDPNPAVREAATHAVGEIGDPRAVPALIRLLDDGNPDVREHAIDALGEIRDSTALRGLIGALKSPDATVRKRAAEALGQKN